MRLPWILPRTALDLLPAQPFKGLEKALSAALYISLCAAGLIGASGVWLITLGYDEAWILRGIQGILNTQPAETAVAPVLTTGGIFALAQVIMTGIFGTELWIQRSFSLVCTALIVVLVWKWSNRSAGTSLAGPLGIAALFATPGFFVLGTTAYATLPALLLVLASFGAYEALSPGTWRRRFVLGLLGGLAAATRFNCGFALPALLVVALFSGQDARRRQLTDVIIASAIGAGILFGCIFLYASVGNSGLVTTQQVTDSALRTSLINYPEYLNRWNTAEGFSPLPLLVLATCVGGFVISRSPERRNVDSSSFAPWAALLCFGWMAWAAWLVAAPIPHLRYIMPAVAAFWIVLGLGTASLHAWGLRCSQPIPRVAALLIALSCTVSSIGSTARNLIHGNGNVLAWEWAGQSRTSYFTRFRHKQYQVRAANYLRETTGEGEAVLALGLNQELGYLADRAVFEARVLSQRGFWDPKTLPRRIVLSPVLGNFLYLNMETRRWIDENCTLEAQFGPYSFYRVHGSYPEEFSFLRATGKTYSGHPLSSEYR